MFRSCLAQHPKVKLSIKDDHMPVGQSRKNSPMDFIPTRSVGHHVVLYAVYVGCDTWNGLLRPDPSIEQYIALMIDD